MDSGPARSQLITQHLGGTGKNVVNKQTNKRWTERPEPPGLRDSWDELLPGPLRADTSGPSALGRGTGDGGSTHNTRWKRGRHQESPYVNAPWRALRRQEDPLSPSGMRRCCARPARSHPAPRPHSPRPHSPRPLGRCAGSTESAPLKGEASARPPRRSLSSGDRGADGTGDPHRPAMGRASARGGHVLRSMGQSLRKGAGGTRQA